jgi:hypothetical protein
MRRQLVCAIVGWIATSSPVAAQSVTAFVRFNVVPMTSDTVLRDHTVLVTDGRITAIGKGMHCRIPLAPSRPSRFNSGFCT